MEDEKEIKPNPFLKKALNTNKWFVLPAIFVLYISSAFLMLVGLIKLALIALEIFNVINSPYEINSVMIAADFIGILDIYILSLVFYIFSIGVYKLFIGNSIGLSWVKIENMHGLKSQMAKMSVLFLCTMLIQKVTEWENPRETLYFGIVIVLTCIVLIWFFKVLDDTEDNHNNHT